MPTLNDHWIRVSCCTGSCSDDIKILLKLIKSPGSYSGREINVGLV